ncbi:ABC transporter ATP-binding protein [Geovibrio thiophilus]|uniref:ABC transporter ATP-binding protein n=1 Tax=Geovibrio thiophilus TaxID=139438 RepID=A0A3R5V1M8_9BACT|nr:ABC transporter ATP-binding protein [Geovibrio thiophilus]QAR33434.1 ABC transporter ATP-binding protein [Geovibrio thiophilus]
MIELRNLTFKRGGFSIDVPDLTVEEGEKIALIGENGSGKSTLLHILTGLIACDGVHFSGRRLNGISRRERAGMIAFMPQLPSVVFPFTVFEVVRLGAYAAGYMKDADSLTEEALTDTALTELRDRAFSELSGGEKRRVMIARALNQRTGALILDEPVSMLDVRHSLEILKLLTGSGRTLIASMHEVNLSVNYFDRIWMMNKGKLIYDVPARDAEAAMLSEVFNVQAVSHTDHFTFRI